MDDITKDKNKTEEKKNKKQNFIIIINDFYYYDSANNLRDDLIKKTNMTLPVSFQNHLFCFSILNPHS